VLQWMQRQLPQEEVISRADYEIINDGINDIDIQLEHIIKKEKI
jgi:dephospho-CoA kinase